MWAPDVYIPLGKILWFVNRVLLLIIIISQFMFLIGLSGADNNQENLSIFSFIEKQNKKKHIFLFDESALLRTTFCMVGYG